MGLVMYKHLLMSYKIKNKKIRKTINKRKRNEREIRKQLIEEKEIKVESGK